MEADMDELAQAMAAEVDRQERARARRRFEAFLAALDHFPTRIVLTEIMLRHGMLFDDVMPTDPVELGRVMGRRSVALALRRDIEAVDPTMPPRMEQEYHEHLHPARKPKPPTEDARDG